MNEEQLLVDILDLSDRLTSFKRVAEYIDIAYECISSNEKIDDEWREALDYLNRAERIIMDQIMAKFRKLLRETRATEKEGRMNRGGSE